MYFRELSKFIDKLSLSLILFQKYFWSIAHYLSRFSIKYLKSLCEYMNLFVYMQLHMYNDEKSWCDYSLLKVIT